MTTKYILNDERYGMRQEFDSIEELRAEIAKCCREWWIGSEEQRAGVSLEEYTAITCDEAERAAEEE